ncbi:Mur ligase [Xylariaceae sp. FL0804]|nr:Mur ligase [Xylariaceae sp. FL0804]
MIQLGLQRISALLKNSPIKWQAIHVAGTNGKGSICAYLTAMLKATDVSCGTFTSPHLVDRWDCISINGKTVAEDDFTETEASVIQRDREENIGASEFELLTATAFEIFRAQQVQVAVVEAGVGGRLDATNVLDKKAATVISSIGLDHEALLGNTVEEIALQKAGIMRPGVPCVVAARNSPSVVEVIQGHADSLGAPIVLADGSQAPPQTSVEDGMTSPRPFTLMGASKSLREHLADHQKDNLACAWEAFRLAFPHHATDPRMEARLVSAVTGVQWPGRLHFIDGAVLTERATKLLLDGAHNPQGAEALSRFINQHVRSSGPVTWVLAATAGKDLETVLTTLLKDGDSVAAVEFGPVDGMPWVKPVKSSDILTAASRVGRQLAATYSAGGDILAALEWASRISEDRGGVVVTGSLYLISDVLRLYRSKGGIVSS